MTDKIQILREKTGAGVMVCKKAFDEANGDLVAAERLIIERGIASADKKAERVTSAGRIETYIHAERIGVILDLRCETDFVARTDDFKTLAHDLAMQIAAMNPADTSALLEQPNIRDAKRTVGEALKQIIAKLGENIRIERFCRYEL